MVGLPPKQRIVIGQTIAHYKVTAKLGAGGMGEVYRATDTKLGREVALKVLPLEFAQDAQRMQRFQREAQVLASLNHNNIASIYGLEHQDKTQALAMELVEGPTLAERIALGAVPIEEALSIARQIAQALEYAHEHGIIHRDLKPANIKLTPEGQVKVLDFGLAKALQFEDAAASTSLDVSPTLSIAATKAGIILGTAAYMPPEQARGKRVDRRADIWAFGVVLFEMLTGKQLFSGETVSDVLAAVLTRNPDWARLPAVPHHVERLLRRCLQKDPLHRLRDIGDARVELEDPASAAASLPAAPPAPRRQSWALLAGLCGVALLLGGAAGVYLYRGSMPGNTTPGTFRFDLPLSGGDLVPSLAISPDGRSLAYALRTASGDTALWVRAFDSVTPRRLAGTEGGRFPFWSPDGRSLGFFASGELKVIELVGGSVRSLAKIGTVEEVRGGTWGANDFIVYAPTYTGPLMSIRATGGEPQPATKLPEDGSQGTHRLPRFLPDGVHFLLYAADGTGNEPGTICLVRIGSTEVRELAPTNSAATFLPPGFLLFVKGRSLLAQRFDLQKLELVGDPLSLDVEWPRNVAVSGHRFLAAAENAVAYQVAGSGSTRLVWVDRTGRELETAFANPEADAWLVNPRLAPDGKRIAVAVYGRATSGDIWVVDSARKNQTRMTFVARDDQQAIWSPDGQELMVSAVEGNSASFLFLSSAGQATERPGRQFHGVNAVASIAESWFPDGQNLLYTTAGATTQLDLWLLPRKEGSEPTPFLVTPFNEYSPDISPDGRWVAYVSDVSGSPEVYVRSSRNSAQQWRISDAGGQAPRWRSDGRELFFVDPASRIQAVATNLNPTFSAGRPKSLFTARLEETGGRQYDVAPGGQRFLISQRAASSNNPMVVVLGWAREIEAKIGR